MPLEQLPLLAAFVIATAGSPGPANALFLASGAAFGWRATLPFVGGTLLGFIAVGAAVGLGLAAALQQRPWMALGLALAGSAYLLYLAYKIATAQPSAGGNLGSRFRFRDGVVIHPLNPKAWMMMIAAFGQFLIPGEPKAVQLAVIIGSFILLGGSLNVLWAVGGEVMTARLKRPQTLQAINRVLAAILVGVVFVMLAGQIGHLETDARARPRELPTPISISENAHGAPRLYGFCAP